MIGREKRMLLRHYMEQGMSITALSQRLGISRDTIHRWIRNGELDRDLDRDVVRYRPRPPVPTKLGPYKPIIRARLEAYPELSGVRLLEEVRAAGYTGGYTQLKEYVRQIRPVATPEPVIRFETPPGHQAQVDFARFRFPWGVRYALLVVLGYSRMLWLRFYRRQDMRTLITGLEDAFTFFGGVPQELLFDQMKTVITICDSKAGRSSETPSSCASRITGASHLVRAGRTVHRRRARVERPVRYVRSNFVYGREFLNDADLDHQRGLWLERVANVRVHRTTRERPTIRFERDERLLLQPTASRPYYSLILEDEVSIRKPRTRPRTLVEVEKRPLTAYARLAGGGV